MSSNVSLGETLFIFLSYSPDLRLEEILISNREDWVTLRNLLSPSFRTFERWNISDGSSRFQGMFWKVLNRIVTGQMLLGAVRLKPTESLYCCSVCDFIPEPKDRTSSVSLVSLVVGNLSFGDDAHVYGQDHPLILWGLTLGVMADFLELIDLHSTSKLWRWPTFSPLDMRLMVWLLTYKFRSRKLRTLTSTPSRAEIDGSGEGQIGSCDATRIMISNKRKETGSESGLAGGYLLDGYFDQLWRAFYVAQSIRLAVGSFCGTVLIHKYRQARK